MKDLSGDWFCGLGMGLGCLGEGWVGFGKVWLGLGLEEFWVLELGSWLGEKFKFLLYSKGVLGIRAVVR